MNKSITSILTFALILVSFFCYSQEEIYIDENIALIDTTTYKNKCKNILLKCLEYKTDSLVMNKVLYKFQFGKLTKEEYTQIKNVLTIDSDKKIEKNDFIIIKYYDSLLNFKRVNERHLIHLKKAEEQQTELNVRNKYHEFNEKIFLKNRKNWIKKSNKCIKRYENKFQSKAFYIYKHEQSVVDNYKNFDWIKDRGIFKHTFFKIMFNYRFVILKPDGEYFLSGGHLTDKRFEKLLKTNDWSKFKEDWNTTYKKNILNGEGIFKKVEYDHNTRHCL